MRSLFSPLCLFVLASVTCLLNGCGGGVDDPFQRVRVHGSATVAGTPVTYGLLRLTGEKKDELAANLVLTIREGRFDSEVEGLAGLTAGQCDAELHQYADEAGEKPVGTWTGVVTVPSDGGELKVDVPEGALTKAPKAT